MKDDIITSKKLKEEAEKETGRTIIESNTGATRYSSRDKSYSNLIDFFVKMGKTNTEKTDSVWTRMSSKERLLSIIKGVVFLAVIIFFLIAMQGGAGRAGLIGGILALFILWFVFYKIKG